MRVAALLMALSLGCGGAPEAGDPPPAPPPEVPVVSAPAPALTAAPAAAPPTAAEDPDARMLISAPDGVDRWEPSGGVARGDRLWVVNDRDGWLVAYALPLKAGRNAPVLAHRVVVQPGRIKFEGLAPADDGGLYLLETMKRSVWRCDDPEGGCPTVKRLELDSALDALETGVPKPVKYITYEAIAAEGAHVLVGSRGYETKDGIFHPWALVAEPDGRTTYDGQPWRLGDRDYGLSDMARDGDALWMTWSHEAPGSSRADVAGLIARAPIGADGRPGVPVLCQTVPGKPEGITRHGDALIVIFDVDGDRKDLTDKSKFPLRADEDRVMVLPVGCPDGRPKTVPAPVE